MRQALIGLVLLAAAAAGAPAQTGPVNLDFEAAHLLSADQGWLCPTAGYKADIARDNPKQGGACARLSSTDSHDLSPFGNLMQTWDARPYRGKRLKIRSAVRTELESNAHRAKLWLRIDCENDRIGFLDNMGRRQITHREWQYYDMVADVPDDALTINFGLMLIKQGRAWLDDVTITTEPIPAAPVPTGQSRAPGPQTLKNLTAFTRLLSYVRFFHPSDAAAATDWDAFAVAGVQRVEAAADDAELARALNEVFQPIAPTVWAWVGGGEPPLDRALLPDDPTRMGAVRWEHLGVGTGSSSPQNIYRSERRQIAAGEERPPDWPSPREPFRAVLTENIGCRVPLVLFTQDGATMPPVVAPANARAVSADDPRATRLAAVALAWGVLQHFYPYFDVVEVDWAAALQEALHAALRDADDRAFLQTLRRLAAQLQDGHAHVWHPGHQSGFTLPLVWAWVGSDLVVTHVAPDTPDAPTAGDVVVAIDGRPVRELRAAAERLISAATVGWREHRLLDELAKSDRSGATTLDLRGADGAVRTVTLQRVAPPAPLREPRPEPIAEIRPGVMYVDLDRITDQEFAAALPTLSGAAGLVFDLRGYPSRLSTIVLEHLIGEAGTCAQWHVPFVTRPDRSDMTFRFSNWPVTPKSPRLTGRTAFVTDGRAISYAETYLGIVERYRLGEIVGQPTAGTNGNVNAIDLPGNYHLLFTGMRVLKHDGSRHHGVGIQPTVRVARTIAGIASGRDELLERALEIVTR